MKRLAVDLVILNERAASYVQDLQIAIETLVAPASRGRRLGAEPARGTVFVLRADLMPAEARALLQSVARVVLVGAARHARRAARPPAAGRTAHRAAAAAPPRGDRPAQAVPADRRISSSSTASAASRRTGANT